MATTYQIFPLYLGEIITHDKSSFTYQCNQGVKMACPFFAFLLKSSDGRNVLVDTGPCTEEWALQYHMPISIPEGRDILSVLKNEHSVTPEDIDYIICTHLHWDHASGNHLFPGKTIYVQRAEWHYALDPLPIHRGTYESPQYGVVSNWLRASNQISLIEGDTVIDDGIELILVPGHSEGMQSVLIRTTDGEYLLGGDCINLYENWEGNGKLPHIVAGLHSDLKAYFKTYEKIEQLERDRHIKILPGHDIKLLDYSCYPHA